MGFVMIFKFFLISRTAHGHDKYSGFVESKLEDEEDEGETNRILLLLHSQYQYVYIRTYIFQYRILQYLPIITCFPSRLDKKRPPSPHKIFCSSILLLQQICLWSFFVPRRSLEKMSKKIIKILKRSNKLDTSSTIYLYYYYIGLHRIRSIGCSKHHQYAIRTQSLLPGQERRGSGNEFS